MGPARMTRRLSRANAAAVVAALIAAVATAAPAQADTTVIGETSLQSNAPVLNSTGPNTPVFQGDSAGGYVLAAPRSGTITSWSFLSGGAAPGKQFELGVLAPVDNTGTNWQLVALSAPVAVSSGGDDHITTASPVNIAIGAGDRIALIPFDDGATPAEIGTPSDGKRVFPAAFGKLGDTQQVVAGADDGQIIPIQATLTFTGLPLPPQNTTLPSISGTARQFETLNGDEGTWQGGVTHLTDAWLRCLPDGTGCNPIPGATATSYVPTRDDVGFALRFQVTASNPGGDSAPAQSKPTAPIAQGVLTARLSLAPNPTCTGIPTTFDASASVSPDGIKSYAFSIIDLYAAAQLSAPNVITSEGASEFGDAVEATALTSGGPDAQFLINNFDGRPTVTSTPTFTETFDWDREVNFSPNDPLTPQPGALARDIVGVLVIVTDFQGRTAEAVAVQDFAQRTSTASRAKCPKLRRSLTAPEAVLISKLVFSQAGQPQMRTACTTRVACVGSVAMVLRSGSGHARDARRARSPQLLASSFFTIPPHKRRTVTLKLTKLGQSRLRHGARVPVTVIVTAISPSGRSIRHTYKAVVRR